MKENRRYWDEQARYGRYRAVIDPNDISGYKNSYIISIRDRAILNALNGVPPNAVVLDFGCGSGNLSKTVAENGYRPVGVDISFDLLQYTHSLDGKSGLFVQYDGHRLPFSSNCFDACLTFWVLNYLTEIDLFRQSLNEIIRVMKPGGRLIAIEQTRRKAKLKPDERKLQRTSAEFLLLFAQAGFQIRQCRIIRRGHFPLIYLIRYKLIPPYFFQSIGSIEGFLGRIFKRNLVDYADTMFVLEKPLI